MSALRRSRARDDDGVTLILFALALVAILFVVALVIDYGQVRNSRQDNKLTADVVAAAGVQDLASDAVPRPWRGVCSALEYLQVNQPTGAMTVEYADGAGNSVGASPCTSLVDQECLASTPTTWAWIHAEVGDHAYDIRSGYTLPDPAFPEDASVYSGDNGVGGGCEHLAVISSKTDPAFFGGIGGATDYDTASRSVGRVRIGSEGNAAPAFLILERTQCDSLTNSVGGSSLGIIIRSPDGVQPGLAHVDSNATGSNCSGSARAVVAETLPGGSPSLTVDGSADGSQLGIIAINALSTGGNPAYAYRSYVAPPALTGMSVQPTPGQIVSRAPVDAKYNPSTAPTISTLHTTARNVVTATGAPAGSTTVGCVNGAIAGTNVYVNCAAFNPNGGASFPNALSVTFSGNVTPGNGRNISFPLATTIVVRGEVRPGGSSGVISAPRVQNFYVGAGVFATGGNHELQVNSTSSTACAGGGSTATRFVIFGGNLELGGRAALCSTFVYLAGPKTLVNYDRQMVVATGSCTSSKPCAKTTSNLVTGAALRLTGGVVVHTAPNEITGPPAAGSQGIEDLALLTESAEQSQVSSGGAVDASGVFFLPNAHFDFSSPTSATPRNAQFIVRTLDLRQGTLEMRPVQTDSISIPTLAGIGMVR